MTEPRVWYWDHTVPALTAAWRDSGVPERFQGHRLATFPATAEARPALAQSAAWLAGDGAPALGLHGLVGRGKTGLGVGLLWELMVHEGLPPLFVSVPDLLESLRPGGGGDFEHLRTAPLLMLDDLGAERLTDWAAERLYLLVNARYTAPDLRTVWTSNLAPSKLGSHLGERITWRIIEMSDVVKLDGPNLRDRKAQR